MTDLSAIVLSACRAHAPQFDQMDAEIQKYALLQMRLALTVGVTELVKAGRSILDHGGDQDYAAFDAALEPFEEFIPYNSTIEADISAAMANSEELPYQCDVCTTPGYGDAPCSPLCDRAALSAAEPVAWLPARRWEQMTAAEPWLTNIVYSEDQAKFFPCIPLYAAPPAPSVAVKGAMTDDEVNQWIGACNHEPARKTLRHYLALRSALSAQVQDVAVFGPFAHLNGIHGLDEEYWSIEQDPGSNDEELFSIPLYSLVDPFVAAPAAKLEATP